MARPMKRMTVTPEMRERILAATDWGRLNAMTDAEIAAARESDPDAVPDMADADISAAKASRLRDVRIRTGLTQSEFSRAYGIPLGTLRDWEQGKTTPDATARSYLRAIARDPAMVARLLAA